MWKNADLHSCVDKKALAAYAIFYEKEMVPGGPTLQAITSVRTVCFFAKYKDFDIGELSCCGCGDNMTYVLDGQRQRNCVDVSRNVHMLASRRGCGSTSFYRRL